MGEGKTDFYSAKPGRLFAFMGWKYDVSKIRIPYFMAAGTGATDDKGIADITKEYAGVASLACRL